MRISDWSSDVCSSDLLALAQLREITACSDGALEVLGSADEGDESRFIRIRLSLSTRHYKTPEGMPFRDRERLILLVYPDFPFRVRFLYFQHKRFLGAPPFQWGRSEEHTSALQSLMRNSYAVFC